MKYFGAVGMAVPLIRHAGAERSEEPGIDSHHRCKFVTGIEELRLS